MDSTVKVSDSDTWPSGEPRPRADALLGLSAATSDGLRTSFAALELLHAKLGAFCDPWLDAAGSVTLRTCHSRWLEGTVLGLPKNTDVTTRVPHSCRILQFYSFFNRNVGGNCIKLFTKSFRNRYIQELNKVHYNGLLFLIYPLSGGARNSRPSTGLRQAFVFLGSKSKTERVC